MLWIVSRSSAGFLRLGTRTDQALRSTNRETHANVEDDGQKVRNGVGDGGGQSEKESKGKNLEVQDAAHVLAQVERLSDDIVAILLDPGTDESSFLLVQERQTRLGLLRGKLGEVDDGDAADESYDDGDDALHDEDPSPACNAGHNATGCRRVSFGRSVALAIVWTKVAQAVHLPETVGKDSGEC